ncbi:predicted protein [Nematostella vectensis]|uniref:Tyr recombinase domain-containing protein n=1 Tax=Nematostella vectensis TaxID=45351 RepID=A7T5I6_NEMVE|nr:predicted protein [Nematostella vectensis]|eukprot:XP_001620875.1 hypothetical protein NEMVEDRAFT_v1g222621 [Nematostella vectensis]
MGPEFREFLLAKLMNAEMAALKSAEFAKLAEIHRKSEKAKAIMRGGQVDQHKYSSSDDDSDEVIPSSPIGKKRSIFLKRALADIHTDTPKVHAIIKDVDPDELRIDSILNKKHLRDKWLQKLERNRKPGTCKAYLGSLSRFLRFLVVEKLEDLKLTEEHVTKVRVQVQEWSASFKKPFKERRWEKHQEDLEKLITPEDVQKFSKSAPMASCDPVKMEKSYKRQKHRCPVPACQKEVIHLPRHLITVHKWSREKALEALSVFDLRAKRTKSEAVPEQRAKRTYKRRVCSFPGCNLIVRRLHNHLNAKHKLSRHDERYKQLLKESRWEEIGEDFQEECVVEISSDTESEPEQEPDPQSQSQSKGKGQSQSKSSQSSTMSSNEEEMCLQEIHRKSEKAKAIMRGGQVDQHKYSSSDDDSDEVIPSSPIGKKRSIFLKRALADIHTDTPKVHAIIKDVDPDELRIDSILNKKHLRDKWLQKLERNRKPGTCKAYLGSLSRFLRFLVVEKLEDLKLTEEHVTKVRVQVQEWSASFKKPFKERRWEKHQEDLEKLITPEDVQKFSKSAPVRAAISTLGRYMEKEGSPGQTDFCTVRDHLITRLCIENACRAGPLANMTLRDLDRATKDGDEMIVTILKHKTSASAGPAHVVLSPTVFTWLKAYVKYMRNKVSGAGTDPDEKVFISFTASEMTSSMISAQLNSFWQKAVEKIRVNAASFRKAAVSVVHEEHQHLRKDLADLMGHNQKTAEKFYLVRQKSKSAAKTSLALRNIMYAEGASHVEAKAAKKLQISKQYSGEFKMCLLSLEI